MIEGQPPPELDLETRRNSESTRSSSHVNECVSCEDNDKKVSATTIDDSNKLIWDLSELEDKMNEMYVNLRPNIRYGIRANRKMNFVKATCTLTKCHSETGSIWTHFLAALYFIYHLILMSNSSSSETYKVLEGNDDIIFLLKLAAICPLTCFLCSSLYHSYSCINKEVTSILYRIDLIGIGVKIFGLCIVLTFSLYYSKRLLRNWIVCAMIVLFVF